MSVFTDVEWRPKYVLKMKFLRKKGRQQFILRNLKMRTGVLDPNWKTHISKNVCSNEKWKEVNMFIMIMNSGFDIYIPDDVVFNHKRTELVDLKIKCAAYKINYLVPENQEFGVRDVIYTPSAFWVMPRSSI